MASVKTDVNKLKQDRAVNQNQLQSRVEYLENRDRCRNIKLLNIPIQANETPDKCKSTVIGVLKHIFPNLDESHVCRTMRLRPRSVQLQQNPAPMDLGHHDPGQQQMMRGTDGGGGSAILVTLTSEDLVNKILKSGNKALKTYGNGQCRIVDDVSRYTQEKRKRLLEKRDKLRKDGLVALIPFTKTAKLIYRQGDQWRTILPEEI